MTTPALVPASAVRILLDVAYERARQLDRGFDAEHDDRQPLAHWAWLLARRANDLAAPDLAAVSKDEPRRLLLEIATIAVAAVESLDRRPAERRRLDPLIGDDVFTDGEMVTHLFGADGGRAVDDSPHSFVRPPLDDRPMAPCWHCQQSERAPIHREEAQT